MANVKLNFLHVCENALVSQDGKLSVIGIFNQMRSAGFPFVYPKFSIVSGISGEVGKHTEEIRIISPTGDIVANVKNEKIEISNGKGSINFIANFIGLVFPCEGKYIVKVVVDESDLGEESFIDVN